uniref:Cell envelope-related transcriptional attenuator n=1 Tax=Cyanothece sp. (strain PCC 7425 / ATCC 29141) TaxID=395961 RepID=B8HUH1_CYAP4
MGRGVKQSIHQPGRVPVIKKSKGSSRKKSPQQTHWLQRLGWGLSFIVVTTASAGLGLTLAMVTPFQSGSKAGQTAGITELLQSGIYGIGRPVNILVMGIDRVPDAAPGSAQVFDGRSDTMLLVRPNPQKGTVNVLTIPRDTRVEIPGYGMEKINAANAEGGANLAMEVVSRSLNQVPVDRYVRISTEAFRELVDLVGGVEIYVPKRMYYVDQTQKLTIDLQPGLQTLNGEQAEGFSRFRYDELGDIGRAQRQQILLRALQKRLTSPLMLARLPQLFSLMQKYIDTDLSLGEMLALMQFGLHLQPSDLNMVLLPGRFSESWEYAASYWIMDPDGMERVVQNYFEDKTFSNSLEQPQRLKIAIQNASSDPHAASQMADFLASHGFRNVYVEQDWPQQKSETAVIAQRGDLEAAQMLKSLLGTGQVQADSTGSLDSDLTLQVGEDWLQVAKEAN